MLISRHSLRQTSCTDREVVLRIHVPLCRTLPVQLDGPLIALFASATVFVAKRKVILPIRVSFGSTLAEELEGLLVTLRDASSEYIRMTKRVLRAGVSLKSGLLKPLSRLFIALVASEAVSIVYPCVLDCAIPSPSCAAFS